MRAYALSHTLSLFSDTHIYSPTDIHWCKFHLDLPDISVHSSYVPLVHGRSSQIGIFCSLSTSLPQSESVCVVTLLTCARYVSPRARVPAALYGYTKGLISVQYLSEVFFSIGETRHCNQMLFLPIWSWRFWNGLGREMPVSMWMIEVRCRLSTGDKYSLW